MKLIECPRDAMQGIEEFIPTQTKVDYINLLLKAGFDTIDFGSFVSPKAVPQMRDTAEVLSKLDLNDTDSKLLAIVANLRGAVEASKFEEIDFLGFPMSISETFQVRNTNKTIADSLNILEEIQNECLKSNKALVAYISMGFGNPYGDPYSEEVVLKFADILVTLGVRVISLSDTIGIASNESIKSLFSGLSDQQEGIEVGCHLHSNPSTASGKIEAAYLAGCRRFDGAIKGYGGCPMADDKLVGNIATEKILEVMLRYKEETKIDFDAFSSCLSKASNVFE